MHERERVDSEGDAERERERESEQPWLKWSTISSFSLSLPSLSLSHSFLPVCCSRLRLHHLLVPPVLLVMVMADWLVLHGWGCKLFCGRRPSIRLTPRAALTHADYSVFSSLSCHWLPASYTAEISPPYILLHLNHPFSFLFLLSIPPPPLSNPLSLPQPNS